MTAKAQEPIIEISEYQFAALYCAELAQKGTIDRVRDYLDANGLTTIHGVHDLIRRVNTPPAPNERTDK